MSKGLTVGHRQKRCVTSEPASYRGQHWNAPMQPGVQYPLISIKLTRTGGEKDWIT